MKALRNPVRFVIRTSRLKSALLPCAALLCIGVSNSFAGPLQAKVQVTTLKSYSGSPLSKPDKILVYDLVANSSNVQVDASQEIRPRHFITGDEKPDAIAGEGSKSLFWRVAEEIGKDGPAGGARRGGYRAIQSTRWLFKDRFCRFGKA